MWDLSKRYDFHPCQMECPEELEKLGLVKKRYLKGPGCDGEFEYVYKGKPEFDQE